MGQSHSKPSDVGSPSTDRPGETSISQSGARDWLRTITRIRERKKKLEYVKDLQSILRDINNAENIIEGYIRTSTYNQDALLLIFNDIDPIRKSMCQLFEKGQYKEMNRSLKDQYEEINRSYEDQMSKLGTDRDRTVTASDFLIEVGAAIEVTISEFPDKS